MSSSCFAGDAPIAGGPSLCGGKFIAREHRTKRRNYEFYEDYTLVGVQLFTYGGPKIISYSNKSVIFLLHIFFMSLFLT